MGTLGRRYKLWWSGNDTGFGKVETLVKEEVTGNCVSLKKNRLSNGDCAEFR